MNKVKFTMRDLIQSDTNLTGQAVEDVADFADDMQPSNTSDVSIGYDCKDDVEAVEIPSIVDKYGRLSDIIEAFELETGMSVIPLKMVNIAPEVESLQRHEIFEFMGERYAMSRIPREKVVEEWQEKILANLSTGLVFEEDLVTNIVHNNQTYKTLSLSRAEWTLLLSKFRFYKQDLVVRNEKSIVMMVFAERVAR